MHVLAPVIATVAVAALAVAAVGTAGVTAYVSWKDAKTGHGRGLGQFAFELLVGGVAGALLGAGTVVFWPVITATVTAASEQAAFLGTYYFGGSALFNSYVLPLIPTIGKVTGLTIFGLNGINIWNDIYGLCTGDNVLLDTVFNGNEEVYGAAQIVLEVTTEGMHQMASDYNAGRSNNNDTDEDGMTKPKSSTADGDSEESGSTKSKANVTDNEVSEEIPKTSKYDVEDDFGTYIQVNYGDQYTRKNRKKALKPNIEYTTPEGYTYKTDKDGNIIEVDGVLSKINPNPDDIRNPYAQRKVGGDDRLADDDGGHLIGSQFYGSGDIDNLVPQNSQINRAGGKWYNMETEWKKAIESGKSVTVNIQPSYPKDSARPSSFTVTYTIGNRTKKVTILNQSGG